jgi:mitochondrial fission protein ELM1
MINFNHKLRTQDELVIWRLIDGKPGHENQSLGLINSLKNKVNCQSFDIKVNNKFEALFNILTSTWPLGCDLPLPDLIVGAGHATHLHLLAAKRAFGGKTIVLMKPSLPVNWFDLCLIPQHDDYRGSGHYIETKGVLNSIRPDDKHHADKSLIMIGGPSKHFKWSDSGVVSQIYELVKQNPDIEYTLTTSPRTPESFIAAARRIKSKNLCIVPYQNTEKGWVADKLAECSTAWITEDSVTMVYEGLTAQVAVGLLNLDALKNSRVYRGVENLVNQKYVTRFDFIGVYKKSLLPVYGFSEADRCSEWLLKHWHLQKHQQAIPVISRNASLA